MPVIRRRRITFQYTPPRLGDHVQVLHTRGHITRRAQISETHEAGEGRALVLVRPHVPRVGHVRVFAKYMRHI